MHRVAKMRPSVARVMRIFGSVWLALAAGPGCATAFSVPAAIVVDSQGNPGGEGAVRATAMVGDDDSISMLASLSIGGGAFRDSSYLLVAPAFGVEGGERVTTRFSILSSLRCFDVGSGDRRASFGAELALLFHLADMGGEDSVLQAGPRLGAEFIPALSGDPALAVVSIGFLLEWVTFDTRGNSWTN